MFDTSAVQQGFGRAAGQYDHHAALQRVVRAYGMSLAAACWPAGSRILDLGAGTGAFTQEAKRHNRRWEIFSLDLAWGMCRVAGQDNHGVIQADAETLPFSNAVFDGIFSSLMLQWCNTPCRVFSETLRVLRPGGTMVMSCPVQGTLSELQQAFCAVDDAPHVSDFRQPHDVLAAAEQAGLQLVKAEQRNWTEYYDDTIALMRNLQAIGATNKQRGRRRGLMTSQQFARLEQAYRSRFSVGQGLPASWHILFMSLKRPL